MRKFIATLLAAPLFLTACGPSQSNKYVINGTFEMGQDGDTVILQKMANRKSINMDTTIIEDGKFVFEGVVDTVCMYSVNLKSASKNKGLAEFMMEVGHLNIEVTKEKQQISGTLLNDNFQNLINQIEVVNIQARNVIPILRDKNVEKAKHDSAMLVYQDATDKIANLIAKTTEENINNELGITLFEQQYPMFKDEVAARIIKMIKSPFSERQKIQKIRNRINTLAKTAVGKTYLDFSLATPEGKEIKLSDFVGKSKIILIDFWASWCGPCRKEMPNMVKAYADYHKKGLEIVGVSFDDNGEKWKNAIEKLNITWPQMSDLKGWGNKAGKLYGVRSIPYTVLIDQDGKIIAKDINGEKLLEKLAELLK